MSQEVRRDWLVSARRYMVAAVLCALFSATYEYFSHGVWSAWMVLLFAYPLLLGAIPAVLGALLTSRVPQLARQLWACGVMTLTMGSCLLGVLDIYGTTSPLTTPYLPIGLALLFLAACLAKRSSQRDEPAPLGVAKR